MKKIFKGIILIMLAVIVAIVAAYMLVGICGKHTPKYISEQELDNGYSIRYMSRQIYPNDTVSEIATEIISDTTTGNFVNVDQEIEEIRRLNNLNDDCKITTYKYIVVPYIVKE